MIIVHIEPGGETQSHTRLTSVLMLQRKLGLRVNDALVIRGETLLTPDTPLADDDEILIRKVMSTG